MEITFNEKATVFIYSLRIRISRSTMQKIPNNTYLINKNGKYCPNCGKYTIRLKTTCPHCRANWPRRGRCSNCEAAIDPKWSYCEICGVETARAQRLKRAKTLSQRAKLLKVAHSEQPPPPSPRSPDPFGSDPDLEELAAIESLSSGMSVTEASTASDK